MTKTMVTVAASTTIMASTMAARPQDVSTVRAAGGRRGRTACARPIDNNGRAGMVAGVASARHVMAAGRCCVCAAGRSPQPRTSAFDDRPANGRAARPLS